MMKLATAYVEIAARTDEFRRQLHEASQLAEQTGRTIARSLRGDEPWPKSGAGDETGRAHSDSAIGGGNRVEKAESSLRSAGPLWPAGTSRLLSLPPGAAGNNGDDGSRDRSATAILKQQLDLARKEVELLQKQLEVLKEIRQGVPAVLT